MKIALIVIGIIAIVAVVVLNHPAFGASAWGKRSDRVSASQNYRDGAFQNLEETTTMTSNTPTVVTLWNFLFKNYPNLKPTKPVESVKTDLNKLDLATDQVVWFGHSSYLLVSDGKKFLVDPVLDVKFPASLFLTPYKGSDIYHAADIPAVDYLIITHDHWDHLDYATVKALRDRVGHVVCALGVADHFKKWGFDENRIIELDWDQSYVEPMSGVKITCLPARHFSGRLLKRGQTLWASYMVETPGTTTFVGGDSGYGKHFEKIAKQFPNIDLAMMEDGQYDKDWANIHTLPEQLVQEIKTLKPATTVPVHNGKFTLANHPWDEPVRLIEEAAKADTSLHVVHAVIGKPIAISKKPRPQSDATTAE